MRVLFLVLLIAGCSSVKYTAPVEPPPIPPAPEESLPPPPPAHVETAAVAGLLQSSRADADAGRLGSAAATLERALRIEPRNARLWHELARVRMKQGDFAQAETVAARSNTWAGSDKELQSANQRLIQEARAARGMTGR